MLGVGVEQEEIARMFAALDTDGDRRITCDEWRAGYARYVSGDTRYAAAFLAK